MADETHLASLLVQMQRDISNDIAGAKDELSAQIGDVKETQAEQRRELGELKTQHAELKRVVEERTGGIGLTKPQKTALWTVVGAAVTELARHLAPLFSGLAAWIKGGAPRP